LSRGASSDGVLAHLSVTSFGPFPASDAVHRDHVIDRKSSLNGGPKRRMMTFGHKAFGQEMFDA
jgi:hypothetical protein